MGHFFKRYYISISFFLVLFILAFFSVQLGCDKGSSDQNAQVSGSIEKTYLGDTKCASCHAEAYNDWINSHHAKAMQRASDSTVLGDFENIVFEANGVKSKFFKKGNSFFINTRGHNGLNENFEVKYTFGIAPLQQYLVAYSKGRLQALRTAWDTEKGEWFHLHPDLEIDYKEWLHWTGASMTWNSMCADCHSTNLKKNYFSESDSFHTTWDLINVSCEACHGPGSEHINYVASDDYRQGKKTIGSNLNLTASIKSTKQVDQCGVCHSRREPITDNYNPEDHFMDHYIPEILGSNLYHADGQILDEVYVYGSFLQSKMYHNGVKCTDCHEPHTLQLKFEGNKLCLQCHEPEKYDLAKHHFHEANTESSKCINCHMPGKLYMGNDFRRDHSFRVPRPDLSEKYGVPNSCNGCHDNQSAEWAAKAIDKQYGTQRAFHFSDVLTAAAVDGSKALNSLITLVQDTAQPAIARATAVMYLSRQNSLEGLETLVKSMTDGEALVRYTALQSFLQFPREQRIMLANPMLQDSIRAIRMTAAYLLSDIPASSFSIGNYDTLKAAINEYVNYLKVNEDLRGGQFMKGVFYNRLGNFPKAETAYLKVLHEDSLFNMARMNLAVLYNQMERNKESRQMLEMVIAMEPEYGPVYYSMALLLNEDGLMEEALTYFEQSADKDNNNSRIYYNWGLTLQNLQRSDDAEIVFKKGLTIEPTSARLHNALCILYYQQSKWQDAKYHAELLVEMYPSNSQFLELLQRIETAQR